MPDHGEVRERGYSRKMTEETFVTPDGQKTKVSYAESEGSYEERWCSDCEEWVRTDESALLMGYLLCPRCQSSWEHYEGD